MEQIQILHIFLCENSKYLNKVTGNFYPTDHPWIKEDGEAPDKPIDHAVLDRLKQFRAMNKFKKAALRVCFFPLIHLS